MVEERGEKEEKREGSGGGREKVRIDKKEGMMADLICTKTEAVQQMED